MTPSKSRIFLIWLPLCLFFSYQFILRVSPNVMTNEILSYFQINATHFGILTSLYYLGYSLMQIPIGILLDQYGPKYVSAVCVLLCIVGAVLFSLSNYWPLALLSRFLIGVGSSGAFISSTKVVRSWAPEKYFSLFMSATITVGLLSAHQGGALTSYLMEIVGWHKAVLYLGLAGLALFFFILTSVKNNPKKEKAEMGSLDKVFLNKLMKNLVDQKILWIGLWGAFLTGPLYVVADVWGISYMTSVFGWKKDQANHASSIIFFGMACGGPVIAAISDKLHHHRKGMIAVLAFGMAFILIAEMIFKPCYAIVLSLNFVLGALCSYQILVFSLVVLNTPSHLSGVTFGVVNTINMLSGFVYLPLVGRVLDYCWDGAYQNGIPLYSPSAYQAGISVIVIGLLLGGIGFLFTKIKKT
ncbi:MAG: MFS transporter [Alphaproteobacteria bacterium]